MKIEDQVCSEFQSKRLGELGVNAFAHFVWVPKFPVFNDTLRLVTMAQFDNQLANSILSQEARNLVNFYPAYTVAEVGVMLPCEAGMIGWEVWYSDHLGTYHCAIRDFVKWKGGQKPPPIAYESEEETMAQAMADTLIYSLENKLITPDQVNQSLKQ